MGKPNDLPAAKKHKSMDSDEDDEEPQNEPGTPFPSQPFVTVLPFNQGPAATSQGPVASANSDDEDTEKSDECGTGSLDSGRTVLYPDLHNLTDDEHWTATPVTHRYAAAAGFFLICDYGERRTTGYIQFDFCTKCAGITVPRRTDRRFQQHTS